MTLFEVCAVEERDIFLEAIEIADPVAQSDFLDQVCSGDTALRNRLRDLFAMHNQDGDFLKTPAIDQIKIAMGSVRSSSGIAGRERGVSDRPGDLQKTEEDADETLSDISLSFLQPSTWPDSLGRIGEYEVVQVLGRGAFGIVLKAFDEKLRRMVAIKVISPDLVATSSVRKRFLREARAFAAVRDPNAVHIYAIEEQPVPYLVMEYVPGQTIQQRIDECGPMGVLDVLQIGQQIASGLAAAHAVGLIHRDIKPANILLEDGGNDRVKITDFGLARALDGDNLTQTEVIAGTPMYMSPEQALGEPFDQRADLFSLGSVMYAMLSGRPPFKSTTTAGLLKRVAEEMPQPIQEIVPTAPDWFCRIIGKLHEKKPNDRFASAKEVADLLSRCRIDVERGQVPVLPGFEPHKLPGSSWRTRGIWLVASIGLLCLLAVPVLSTFLTNPRNPHPSVEKTDKTVEGRLHLPNDLEMSFDLGLQIQQEHMGDGSFSDVSYQDHVLSLDATSRSRQLWVNFPDVESKEMTIETQFRVVNLTKYGFAKLVFMPKEGEQFGAIIDFGTAGYEVYIQSSAEAASDAPRALFLGKSPKEWIDMKFTVSAEKYSVIINGKLALERPRESRHSGYAAVACSESLCEMKNLRVKMVKVP